jgi:hypothetical protein
VPSVTVLRAGDGAVVAFADPVLSEAVLAELEACLDAIERGGGRTPGYCCGAPFVRRDHGGRQPPGL